jgi:hypothetical protein
MSVDRDHSGSPQGSYFEFDSEHKILLARFVGQFTDETLTEFYEAIRKYATATDACAGIMDLSFASDLAASSETIRRLATREPAIPDATRRPRFIVAPSAHMFGLSRMFQLAGERTRPLLEVVRTIDEALAKLGVKSAKFERLDPL